MFRPLCVSAWETLRFVLLCRLTIFWVVAPVALGTQRRLRFFPERRPFSRAAQRNEDLCFFVFARGTGRVNVYQVKHVQLDPHFWA